jgi:hypothetical protein
VVSDSILRIVISADFLASISRSNLDFPSLRLLFAVFSILQFEYFLFENLNRPLFVPILHSFLLVKNTQPGGNMGRSTGTLCLIHMLSTRSRSPHKLKLNILIVDGKVKGNDRHHSHSYCRTVQPPHPLSLRHPDNLMHSRLALHNFVDVRPTHLG